MAFIFSFTGEETLIMMTKDFDPISEFPCHSEEFGEGTSKGHLFFHTFKLILFIFVKFTFIASKN